LIVAASRAAPFVAASHVAPIAVAPYAAPPVVDFLAAPAVPPALALDAGPVAGVAGSLGGGVEFAAYDGLNHPFRFGEGTSVPTEYTLPNPVDERVVADVAARVRER